MSPLMRTSRSRRRGFTLIELEVLIVMVGVGLAGVLTAMNLSVKSSADPMVRKQMLSIAEGMLAEVALKAYDDPLGDCTPTTVPSCRNDTQEHRLLDRRNYNDISDYNGFATTGIFRIDGSAVAGLEGYDIVAVTVDDTAQIGGVGGTEITCGSSPVKPVKRITVSVKYGSETLDLSAYRTCYDRV